MSTVPTGKVKWYDTEKGFGFFSQEHGEDVYVRSSALPSGVTGLKPGQRVEFGMAAGKRGPQALSVTVLEEPPSVAAARSAGPGARSTAPGARSAAPGARSAAPGAVRKHTPDELHGMVEDMISMLEATVQTDLRRGRYPDRKTAQRISEVVRAVARELDA